MSASPVCPPARPLFIGFIAPTTVGSPLPGSEAVESPFGRRFGAADLTPAGPQRIAAGLGGCVALVDTDNDGHLDLFEHLFRNDGNDRRTEITAASGLGTVPGDSVPIGCVAGDYDNDRLPDLFVPRYGVSSLYHNQGGGRFSDVRAAAAGLRRYPFLPGAAALVHDGDLDLVIAGLADLEASRSRAADRGVVFPADFAPAPLRLLHNNGNGTFTDTTADARLQPATHAIAIVPTDFDNRRDIDLLVVNRGAPPLLFQNLRDGTFRDVASEVGLVMLAHLRTDAYEVYRTPIYPPVETRAPLPALPTPPAPPALPALIRTLLTLAILATIVGCDRRPEASKTRAASGRAESSATASPGPGGEWFTEAARESGLDFVHFNGMTGEFYFPEIMGPGVALLDYDGDGDLDVFIVQGQMLGPGKTLTDARLPPGTRLPLRGRLYRNDLQVHADGTRTQSFTDVTEASGIDARGYGMGVAVGDFNNDGCVDLYVTNFGHNQLFRNNCDGTFTDVSKRSGVDAPGWGVSAAFLDYDRDGWLDLYVGNYVHYDPATDTKCFTQSGGSRDYCPPRAYRARRGHLYHNNGNGTFTDVTAKALVGSEFGPALGVVTADFNGDGWIDIFVANDGDANQLWINQRDGTFRNTALFSGAAFSAVGKPEAGMGVDAGDFDNDGDEDLFITHLTNETSGLFVNDGSGAFTDQRARSGLGPPSLVYTGFGAAWFDFDNDGWLDLLTVNGTVQRAEGRARDFFPYDQRKQLFRNLRNGRFEEVTGAAGAVFKRSTVGRGAAFGDIDNDGDTDVVVANANGPVELLINNIGARNHWLGLRLVGGEKTPRDMLGARVAVVRTNRPTLWRRARSDGSYASANDPRVLVGLGDSTEVPTVRVIWPDGRSEEWSDIPIDRYTTVREGTGR